MLTTIANSCSTQPVWASGWSIADEALIRAVVAKTNEGFSPAVEKMGLPEKTTWLAPYPSYVQAKQRAIDEMVKAIVLTRPAKTKAL